MSIETELITLLRGNAGVSALVGQRVMADRAEAGTSLPFVVFTRVSSEPFVAVDGALLATRATLDVQCWAENRSVSDQVAAACEAAIRAGGQQVTDRSGLSDLELDLQGSSLTVEWFSTT